MKERFTSQTGFTLIEVIIVVLLLGIAAALVVPKGLETASGHGALDAQTQQLAGLVRLAREKAIAKGTDYKVIIEGSTCRLESGGAATSPDRESMFAIDSRVSIMPQPPLGNVIIFNAAGLPEGGGGTIKLETKGRDTESKKLVINEQGMIEIR